MGVATPAREALHLARELVKQQRNIEATTAYQQALLFEPTNLEALRALVALRMRAGDLDGAQGYAQRALEAESGDAQLWLVMGRVRKARGDLDGALGAYREALARDGNSSETWISMGIALREQQHHEHALDCYVQALRLEPRSPLAWINAANVLLDLGRVNEAEANLRRATQLSPGAPDPYLHLGKLYFAQARGDEAEQALRAALQVNPNLAAALILLGQVLQHRGALGDAGECFRKACALAPMDAQAHLFLAEALRRAERYDEAIPVYERCIALDPRLRIAYANLSGILRLGGRIQEALRMAQRAVAVDPEYVMGHSAVAEAMLWGGDAEGAERALHAVVTSHPEEARSVSNYLLACNYLPMLQPEELARRHRMLGGRLTHADRVPSRSRDASPPRRKLRIGYVSGDFKRHSVAYFVEPLLAAHDRYRYEIACYFNDANGDEVTERLASYADRFIACASLDDEALAQQIRADEVDVLVDLSGHTAGHRLPVFARRAAPVQVTYLGYPTTTGLEEMDYRLTDWVIDPVGAEALNVEYPMRLPGSAFCYRPPDQVPDIVRGPIVQRGSITFGCFNSLAKLSGPVVRAWRRILEAVPGSRLYLKAKGLTDAGARRAVASRFVEDGVPAEALVLQGWESDPAAHFATYGRIDIALDAFPYNGATTTCEALWMGVPVVSWSGATHASRMGASILRAAGLGHLVASSEHEYVQCAVDLARNTDALVALRDTLRARLRASPLLDGRSFARDVERVYDDMWKRWCEREQA